MNLNFCLPKFWVIALFLINSWFLSGAYLKTYTSYGYEIMWVNGSRQGGVQCTWTLTLGFFIFELLPFVYFHTWILSGAYLQDYTSYGYEFSWMVITWGKTGVFCDNLLLLFNLIRCIQLCDKENLTYIDYCDKILSNSSWKMLLSWPKAWLITFFKTRLIKFYLNS